MKIQKLIYLIPLAGALLMLPSCTNRSSDDVWEDTKSAGRHVQRGVKSLGGKQGDSRQVRSRNEFSCVDDEECVPPGGFQNDNYGGNQDASYGAQDFSSPSDGYAIPQGDQQDFVPIQDPNGELRSGEQMARPARETPGEPGGSIPGIQAFRDPATHPELAAVFQPIYFDYNSDLVKGQQNLQTARRIAEFLNAHPNIYVFVEGHTDERGPQAYNLALASRRANTVRNLLVNDGVNPDRLFTISYGKERPVVLEQHEEGWAKNRRAEFKIYEK